MGFNSSKSNVPGATKAGSSASDSHEFTGSIYVSGNVYAQEYHVNVVSSSIVYASGSHKFGDSQDDLQQMTGTFELTGAALFKNDIFVDGVASGTLAGAGSYIGLNAQNQLVLATAGGGGGGGSPGGSDTQIQYNNGGSFGGVATLTYNDSSGDLTVIDDKKLYFGSHSDAHIEYDENDSNKLIVSGATAGIDIQASLNDADAFVVSTAGASIITVDTTVGDEMVTFSKNVSIVDDKKLEFGSDGDAYIKYDEAGANYMVISGSGGDGGIVLSGSIVDVATDMAIYDDFKVYFGSDDNASIEYDANGNNFLVISGSDDGIALSGNVYAHQITSGTLAGGGSYIGLNSENELVLASAGGGGGSPGGSDTQIQYNNGGAFGGVANLTYNDSSGDLTIKDDTDLNFGDSGESTLWYDEEDANTLVISGSNEGTVLSSSIYLSTYVGHAPTTDGRKYVVLLDPDEGNYIFKANFSENSQFLISGSTVITGSPAVAGEGQGEVFRVEGGPRSADNEGNPILYCQASASAGLVGIGTNEPKVELDVIWDKVTNLDDDEGGGDTVYFGQQGDGVTKGALYYLSTAGVWTSASAHATGSGNDAMLAIAKGTGQNQPMLIRGWFHADAYWSGSFVSGKAVYIASGTSATTQGKFSSSAPTEEGSYARIVGHATPDGNVIYFNPSPDWVELA